MENKNGKIGKLGGGGGVHRVSTEQTTPQNTQKNDAGARSALCRCALTLLCALALIAITATPVPAQTDPPQISRIQGTDDWLLTIAPNRFGSTIVIHSELVTPGAFRFAYGASGNVWTTAPTPGVRWNGDISVNSPLYTQASSTTTWITPEYVSGLWYQQQYLDNAVISVNDVSVSSLVQNPGTNHPWADKVLLTAGLLFQQPPATGASFTPGTPIQLSGNTVITTGTIDVRGNRGDVHGIYADLWVNPPTARFSLTTLDITVHNGYITPTDDDDDDDPPPVASGISFVANDDRLDQVIAGFWDIGHISVTTSEAAARGIHIEGALHLDAGSTIQSITARTVGGEAVGISLDNQLKGASGATVSFTLLGNILAESQTSGKATGILFNTGTGTVEGYPDAHTDTRVTTGNITASSSTGSVVGVQFGEKSDGLIGNLTTGTITASGGERAFGVRIGTDNISVVKALSGTLQLGGTVTAAAARSASLSSGPEVSAIAIQITGDVTRLPRPSESTVLHGQILGNANLIARNNLLAVGLDIGGKINGYIDAGNVYNSKIELGTIDAVGYHDSLNNHANVAVAVAVKGGISGFNSQTPGSDNFFVEISTQNIKALGQTLAIGFIVGDREGDDGPDALADIRNASITIANGMGIRANSATENDLGKAWGWLSGSIEQSSLRMTAADSINVYAVGDAVGFEIGTYTDVSNVTTGGRIAGSDRGVDNTTEIIIGAIRAVGIGGQNADFTQDTAVGFAVKGRADIPATDPLIAIDKATVTLGSIRAQGANLALGFIAGDRAHNGGPTTALADITNATITVNGILARANSTTPASLGNAHAWLSGSIESSNITVNSNIEAHAPGIAQGVYIDGSITGTTEWRTFNFAQDAQINAVGAAGTAAHAQTAVGFTVKGSGATPNALTNATLNTGAITARGQALGIGFIAGDRGHTDGPTGGLASIADSTIQVGNIDADGNQKANSGTTTPAGDAYGWLSGGITGSTLNSTGSSPDITAVAEGTASGVHIGGNVTGTNTWFGTITAQGTGEESTASGVRIAGNITGANSTTFGNITAEAGANAAGVHIDGTIGTADARHTVSLGTVNARGNEGEDTSDTAVGIAITSGTGPGPNAMTNTAFTAGAVTARGTKQAVGFIAGNPSPSGSDTIYDGLASITGSTIQLGNITANAAGDSTAHAAYGWLSGAMQPITDGAGNSLTLQNVTAHGVTDAQGVYIAGLFSGVLNTGRIEVRATGVTGTSPVTIAGLHIGGALTHTNGTIGVISVENIAAAASGPALNARGINITEAAALRLHNNITVSLAATPPANSTAIGINLGSTGTIDVHNNNINITAANGGIVLGGATTLNLRGNTLNLNNSNLATGTIGIALGGNALTVAAHHENNAGNTGTIAGIITGTGTLTKTNQSNTTLVLTGNNTYTGLTTVQGGTLRLGAANDSATGWIAETGNITLENDATIHFSSNTARNRTGTITGDGRVYHTGNGTLTLGGVISDGGGTDDVVRVEHAGSGALTLSGANSYTGNTTLTGDDRSLIVTGSLGGTNRDYGGTIAIGHEDSTVTFNPTTTTNNQTLSGNITGDGTLIKQTANQLIITGNATHANTTVSAGQLHIGTGTTAESGHVSGNIEISSGAAVHFNRTNAYTYAGVMSGEGTVTKSNAGSTLIFTGANTYTGTTTVSGGTLQIGNNGTTGQVLSNITNNANVTFNRSNAYTQGAASSDPTPVWSGIISGSGTVTQAGTGTVTLAGAHTYTGDTTLSADGRNMIITGTLGASASYAGVIALGNNSTLTFNRAGTDNQTLSGIISGQGNLTKQADNTLILSGANTYTGTTTVSAGTLQIGAGSTSGVVVGNITNNANVTFNRSNAYTQGAVDDNVWSGIISGSGSVTQGGSGLVTLMGHHTYAGKTELTGGNLTIGNGQAGVANTARLGNAQGIYAGAIDIGAAATTGRALTFNSPDNQELSGAITFTAPTSGQVAGSLTFSRSDQTLSGSITGAGTITNTAGDLRITATTREEEDDEWVNNFTGTTNINGGRVLLGDGERTSLHTVAVASGGTLGVYQLNDGTTTPGDYNKRYITDTLSVAQGGFLALNLLPISGTHDDDPVPTGRSNTFVVENTATLTDSSTINLNTGGSMDFGKGGVEYTILSAEHIYSADDTAYNGGALIRINNAAFPYGATGLRGSVTVKQEVRGEPSERKDLVLTLTGQINALLLTWTGAANGSWNTTAVNWLDNASPPVARTFMNNDAVEFKDIDNAGSRSIAIANEVIVANMFINGEQDWTFTGDDTIKGVATGTYVSGPTLEDTADAKGSLSYASTGTSSIANSTDFAGTLSVTAGTLTLSGGNKFASASVGATEGTVRAGTLTLTNNSNNFGTGITVNSLGVLNIGNDTDTGAVESAIVADGVVNFERNDVGYEHTYAITGTGSVKFNKGTFKVTPVELDEDDEPIANSGTNITLTGDGRVTVASTMTGAGTIASATTIEGTLRSSNSTTNDGFESDYITFTSDLAFESGSTIEFFLAPEMGGYLASVIKHTGEEDSIAFEDDVNWNLTVLGTTGDWWKGQYTIITADAEQTSVNFQPDNFTYHALIDLPDRLAPVVKWDTTKKNLTLSFETMTTLDVLWMGWQNQVWDVESTENWATWPSGEGKMVFVNNDNVYFNAEKAGNTGSDVAYITIANGGVQPGTMTIEKGKYGFTGAAITVNGKLDVQEGTTLGLEANGAVLKLSAAEAVFAENTTLVITGSGVSGQWVTILKSTASMTDSQDNLTIDFSSVNEFDFITGTYQWANTGTTEDTEIQIRTELAWFLGNKNAHGTFNLKEGQTYELVEVLVDITDEDKRADSWDGKSLTKTGPGTLEVTTNNTYTGNTTISAGTLKLVTVGTTAIHGTLGGPDSAGNYGTVHIGNGNGSDGTLSLAHTGNTATLANPIAGAGNLVREAGGTTILTGNSNTYAGTATVKDGGRLLVNTANGHRFGGVSSKVIVESGATLGGTGTIGQATPAAEAGVTIRSGGKLAPGGANGNGNASAIGTLRVDTNLSFLSGSVYEYQIDKTGSVQQSDLLILTGGLLTVEDGAILNVRVDMPSVTNGDSFLVMMYKDDKDMPTETFAIKINDNGMESNFALKWESGSEGNWNLLLTYDVTRPMFADIVRRGRGTANAVFAAEGMDRIVDEAVRREVERSGAPDPLWENVLENQLKGNQLFDVLFCLSGSPVRLADAFAQLHGEVFASNKEMAVYLQHRFARELPSAEYRLGCDDCLTEWNRWATFTGDFLQRRGFETFSGYDMRSNGVVAGFDKQIMKHLMAGLAFGYDNTFADFRTIRGHAKLDSFRMAAYSGVWYKNFFADSYVGWAKGWNSTRRDIDITCEQGTIRETARSTYFDDMFFSGALLGARWGKEEWGWIAPSIGAHFVHLSTPGVTETGAEWSALAVRSYKHNSLRMPVGFKAGRNFLVKEKVLLSPEIRAFYIREWMDDRAKVETSFANSTVTNGNYRDITFTAHSNRWSPDTIRMGAGVGALWYRVSLRVDYDFEFQRHGLFAETASASATVNW